tara:strand:- start:1895 stop:2611 length:717 start_codon:yes stop_codon:yes gene_type:complete
MTISRINVGNIANDGTGDDLRQAFVKVNNNFTELDQRDILQSDVVNLGTGVGVFYTKVNSVLNFRSLIAGDNIALTADGTSITITNNGNIGITTDGDTLNLSGGGRQFGVNGGQNIDTSLSGSNINIAINGTNLVFQDKNPALGAELNAGTFNINNVGTLTATTVDATTINATTINGALIGTVDGVDVGDLGQLVNNTDYGIILQNATTAIELVFQLTNINYGTFISPSNLISDYGSI